MPLARVVRARWILPIDRPPIDGGWIQIEDARIAHVGRGRPPADAEDLGEVAILPGLVNAHTHLELSWLAGLVPPAASMDEWIRSMMGRRRAGAGGVEVERLAALAAARTMRATGTLLVGDISNTLMTPSVLAEAGLGGVVFHELIGFQAKQPRAAVRQAWERVARAEAALPADSGPPIDFSVVAHAPYSVSPALFAEIIHSARSAPLSIHLAESSEEMEFLRAGTGPIRQMIEALGVWTDLWTVPGCDPDQYLAKLGYLRPGGLVVHGVHLTPDALGRLRRAGAVLVTCPRSNLWVGAGSPHIAQFYASGMPVAIGTDSLASASTLSVFDELAEIRRLAPEVSAASLLESATRIGAEALGFARQYGTISAGKRAALVAVQVPAHAADVEEYLVGGIASADVGWV